MRYGDLSLEERFWERVEKTEECWLWAGPTFPNGYGMIRKPGGNVTGAHRISWLLNHGSIPNGLCVCHKCDNRRCVNPGHLFLGTHKDNMKDMVKKGRSLKGNKNHKFNVHPTGDKNPNAKLTKQNVIEIREQANNGISNSLLAKKFKVTTANIRSIVICETWRNI